LNKKEASTATKKATREYFEALLSRNDEALSNLLRGGSNRGADILVTEQIVQDYMTTVFQPFAGCRRIPNYIQSSMPRTLKRMKSAAEVIVNGGVRFGLIGAHYRSSLSARGRRSAFAVDARRFSKSLRISLGDHPLIEFLRGSRNNLLETLWEAIYLEQYFGLFDRKLTLGEWAFEQTRAIPIVILSERCSYAPELQEFRSGNYLRKVVVLPDSLTDALVSKDLLEAFSTSVADGIVGAIKRERETFRQATRSLGEYPEKLSLVTWNRLVRSANSLARASIIKSAISSELSLRHAYATGLVLFNPEGKDICDRLLRLFPGIGTGTSAETKEGQMATERSQLSRLLHVFQSLQFYTRRYGENCVTFPYQRGEISRKREYLGEGSRSSVTLFWDGTKQLSVLNEIVEGARGMFGQLTSAVEAHLRARKTRNQQAASGNYAVIDLIRENSGDLLSGVDVHAVLLATRDLSKALHEGRPRAFSFVLGSPEWLISDLAVVHDLMGGSFPYRITRDSDNPHFYERTLALLRGNSAFFQDDNLALFLPYPGLPLEITHVVRVPGVGAGRRQVLSSFSYGKKAMVTVATYGSGTGEVIHDGEVKAVLSSDGQWTPATSYQALLDELTGKVSQLSDDRTADTVVGQLEPCLRRISEEPGIGGLFVIARERAAIRLKRNSISLTEVLETIEGRSLPELDTGSVYDLARDDGATIVELPSMRVWGRRLLAAGPTVGRGEKAVFEADSEEQIRTLEWGTRRRTALRVSQNLGNEGLAIVISADGPITILQGGAIVAQFGERRLRVQTDRNKAETAFQARLANL
jgi:hypothetical protein